MTEVVTGSEASYAKWFEDYWTLYQGPGKRLAIALKMTKKDQPAPILAHHSHAALIPHWNDSRRQQRALALALYEHKAAIDESVGETVVVFQQGAPQEVGEAGVCLRSALQLRIGIIDQPEFRYSVGRRQPGHQVHPYLTMQARIVVRDCCTLDISQNGGGYELTHQPDEQELVFYKAAIPLTGDRRAYNADRQTHEYPMLIGNEAAITLAGAIVKYVAGTPELNFNTLERLGGLDGFVPLRTDLIFGNKALADGVAGPLDGPIQGW